MNIITVLLFSSRYHRGTQRLAEAGEMQRVGVQRASEWTFSPCGLFPSGQSTNDQSEPW